MVILVLCLFASVSARADDRQAAQELFDQGDGALQEGRFPAARELLQRSLTLYAHPATAFNLAVAHRGIGEPREAIALFDGLLEGRFGRLGAERRTQVERLRSEAEAEVATLRLRACGADVVDIAIDGQPHSRVPGCTEQALELNPGRHTVAASGSGGRSRESHVELAPGEVAELSLELGPLMTRQNMPPGAPMDAAESDDTWIWLLAGTGGVAAIVTVILVIVLLPEDNPPITAPPFGVIPT